MNTKGAAVLVVGISLFLWSSTDAARATSYTEAEFTQLENEVQVLKTNAPPQPAKVGEQIKAITSVATGPSSRAELRFPDHSLTRLGANSRFTLRGEARTLDLNQGTMLLEVPKKMGGAKVRTAAVTAAVTGTTVIFEYMPNNYIKAIVIEGSADFFENAHPSIFRTITAGQMIIMPPNAKTIPNPVDIDLKRLLRTSKLLNFKNLGNNHPNTEHIYKAIKHQQAELQSGELQNCNLVIPGQGTIVNLVTDSFLNFYSTVPTANNSTPPNTPTTPPPGTPTKKTFHFANNTPAPPVRHVFPEIPGVTILNSTSRILADPQLTAWNSYVNGDLTANGQNYDGLVNGPFSVAAFGNFHITTAQLQPYLDDQGAWSVFRFQQLLINGNPDISPLPSRTEPPISNLLLISDNGISLAQDASYYTGPNLTGTTSANTTGNVLDLTTDLSLSNLVLYANKGDITLAQGFSIKGGYTVATFGVVPQSLLMIAADRQANVNIYGSIQLAGASLLGIYGGNNVTIQGPGASLLAYDLWINAGQNIAVNGVPVTADDSLAISAGNSINISNGAQIKMLTSDSEISFVLTTTLGDIMVTNSTLLSDSNLILQSHSGNVTLTNSQLTGTNVTMSAGKAVNVSCTQITANGTPASSSSSQGSGGTNPSHGLSVIALASINVTNSSVLQVLASDPNALLQLIAQQGNVLVDSSTLNSGYGIDVEANRGNVTINSSTLSGNIIKARTTGPNGQLLIGGGSTLSATSLLRLYAEGANGGVTFVGNANLSGQTVQIAGKTVQVNGGTTVTVSNASNLNVYTDTPNYNKGTYGSLQNSSGSQVGVPAGGFSSRPSYK